jgi:hypothetical protein
MSSQQFILDLISSLEHLLIYKKNCHALINYICYMRIIYGTGSSPAQAFLSLVLHQI